LVGSHLIGVRGHVLVSSKRVAPRFLDLEADEAHDLMTCARKVARVIEKAYSAQGLSIAIQDGPAAGQTGKVH
jgi:bis(5'-adenosyl)-triphosphatase